MIWYYNSFIIKYIQQHESIQEEFSCRYSYLTRNWDFKNQKIAVVIGYSEVVTATETNGKKVFLQYEDANLNMWLYLYYSSSQLIAFD